MNEFPRRDLTWQDGHVSAKDREAMLDQRGVVVWLTGLSASGKSTIARELEKRLVASGILAYHLDGDNLRHGLCSDLGFSEADRQENIRRVGEVCAVLADAALFVVASFISPYISGRDRVRATVRSNRFLEVYVDAPLDICESRDPKGLYRKARSGAIADFTGIDAPYEPPVDPDLHLPTGEASVGSCVDRIVELLRSRGFLPDWERTTARKDPGEAIQ